MRKERDLSLTSIEKTKDYSKFPKFNLCIRQNAKEIWVDFHTCGSYIFKKRNYHTVSLHDVCLKIAKKLRS